MSRRSSAAIRHYLTRGAVGVAALSAASILAPGVGPLALATALTPLALADHRREAARRSAAGRAKPATRRRTPPGTGTAVGPVAITNLHRTR